MTSSKGSTHMIHSGPSRWRRLLAMLAVVAVVGGVQHAAPARATAEAASATLLADEPIGARLHELVISSPALGTTTRARLLLPAGFERSPNRRYPVLYLLHGANGDYRRWTDVVDTAAITAAYDLIVVMPDGGSAGFYSDWYNGGDGGPPAWETYHVVELRRVLEERFRADGRYAIAGQSMGGFGALSYASRHPDMFSVVAAFSGAVDTRFAEPVTPAVLSALTGYTDGAPDGVWGNFLTDEVRWRAHNPLDLAPNLHGSAVFLSSGNGVPGHFDQPGDPQILWKASLESAIYAMNVEYSRRLEELGIAATRDIDRPGTHDLRYGHQALAQWLPDIMTALSAARPVPTDFSYRSADAQFGVWGWDFAASWTEPAFTDVRVAGDTISATGDGVLDVTTPPRYRPNGRYSVVGFAGTQAVTADRRGRLAFTIDLGTTAERYTALYDTPGPRPRGPAVAVTIRED